MVQKSEYAFYCAITLAKYTDFNNFYTAATRNARSINKTLEIQRKCYRRDTGRAIAKIWYGRNFVFIVDAL